MSNLSATVVLGQRQRADLTVFGCVQFATSIARVKALGCLKKKNMKRKMTKLDFHRFQVRHSSNVYEQS